MILNVVTYSKKNQINIQASIEDSKLEIRKH